MAVKPSKKVQTDDKLDQTEQTASTVWHQVRRSSLHGQGVFARRKIPAGTRIFEYAGKRITSEQADIQPPSDPDDPFHTFFFMLSSGMIIDGNQKGNDSRWINHSCEPNCETEEDEKGERVFVVAMRDIERGEELSFDYALVIEGRKTAKIRAQYACHCGNANCRTTMLALSPRAIKAARSARGS